MNTATTTFQLGPEFAKYIFDTLLKAMDDGKKEAAMLLWNYLMSFLSQNLVNVIIFLVCLLLVSFLVALTGRWGMFGSVLYHYFYFGVLFITGLIFSPYIFVNIFFDLFAAILYVCCYKSTGRILIKLGLKK